MRIRRRRDAYDDPIGGCGEACREPWLRGWTLSRQGRNGPAWGDAAPRHHAAGVLIGGASRTHVLGADAHLRRHLHLRRHRSIRRELGGQAEAEGQDQHRDAKTGDQRPEHIGVNITQFRRFPSPTHSGAVSRTRRASGRIRPISPVRKVANPAPRRRGVAPVGPPPKNCPDCLKNGQPHPGENTR